MWLEAFHLLTTLHHTYAGAYLLSVNYAETKDSYLLIMRDLGLRYLTVWNLIIQSAYFSACTGEHVLRAVMGEDLPLLRRWQNLRDGFFQALIFPLALEVSSAFWVLFTYDRSLVYPATVDQFVAPYVNHMMHTNITVVAVLEMLLRPRQYRHRGRDLSVLLLICSSYLACFLYTYWNNGVWVYPLYNYLNWTQRILINILMTFIVPSVCYLVGEAVTNAARGKRIQEIKGQKKSS